MIYFWWTFNVEFFLLLFCLLNSDLIDGDDFIEDILDKLTDGLGLISGESGEGFDVGGLGENIGGVLSDFGLNLTSLTADFKAFYQSFTDSMTSDLSRVELLKFKPRSLSRYVNTLQAGSKKSSCQYSARFKKIVYDKLIATFPDPQYDGVLIPGLLLGQGSIADLYTCTNSSCDDFPINNFHQAIAVAYGYATTFDKATSFTIDQLLVPDFNPEAIVLLLNRLKSKNSLFNRFNSTENGLPLDPSSKELFRLEKYLPDIQVALNLAVSTDLSALRFGPQDILEALLPNPSFPSLRALADFAKKELLDLDLAFAADLNVPPLDISSSTVPTIGPDGFVFGNLSVDSTRLFPPAVDLNSIQVRLIF